MQMLINPMQMVMVLEMLQMTMTRMVYGIQTMDAQLPLLEIE
jgi:hypothetical protein